MSKPKAPSAKSTAKAQTSANIGSAVAEQMMNMTGQVTPQGTLEYEQVGTTSYTDPYTKKTYEIPKYNAVQTYTPEQQEIFNLGQDTQRNFGQLAADQSSFLTDYMAEPVDLSTANVENYINDHFRDDFNKQWGDSRSTLETTLANKGIKLGSDAYDRAVSKFEVNKGNAYDNMQGNQFDRAVQSILTERNQPINEITALLSGSQVSQPNYVNTPQANLPTTDVAGLMNSNYQTELNNWNQGVGGLFSLGSSLLTGGFL